MGPLYVLQGTKDDLLDPGILSRMDQCRWARSKLLVRLLALSSPLDGAVNEESEIIIIPFAHVILVPCSIQCPLDPRRVLLFGHVMRVVHNSSSGCDGSGSSSVALGRRSRLTAVIP